jgi:hypothetical protein
MPPRRYTVIAERALMGRNEPCLCIKIQASDLELNIWMKDEELARLSLIEDTKWERRESVQLGESAGALVFWAAGSGKETISILIGPDDEAWDIGLELPRSILSELRALKISTKSA